MTLATSYSKIGKLLRNARNSRGLRRLNKAWSDFSGILAAWIQPATSELRHGDHFEDYPHALPGRNQSLVEASWLQAMQAVASDDGRIRVSGSNTLDVCASPIVARQAIRHFATWVDYLAADGIGIEIRKLDGWRTCAMVDGIAVPIRVRERLHRVQTGNRLSVAIERWLGGRIPSKLAPSGHLELQILRMGVSFASFDVSGELTPKLLRVVSEEIRSMARRQVEYQERMHAVAVAETGRRQTAKVRPSSSGARPRIVQPAQPVVVTVDAAPVASLAETQLAAATTRIHELAEALERLAAKPQPIPAATGLDGVEIARMTESVVSLLNAITISGVEAAKPGSEVAKSGAAIPMASPTARIGRGARGSARSRCVA